MKIVFIGAGNVATNLAKSFSKKGNSIKQIVSRSASSASSLARLFQCAFSTNLNETITDADFYFICVSDDEIQNVAEQLPTVKGIVVHTSGSTSIEVFAKKFEKYGVFYPLQTFSMFIEVNIQNTPVFIEGNNQETSQKLVNFSNTVTSTTHTITSKQRLALHVCGVFANNFTNHMYTLAHNMAKQHNLPFEVFFPLIKETAEKITHRSPKASQTGPAIRKDYNVLNQHKELLEGSPDLKKIYELVSESIIKFSQ